MKENLAILIKIFDTLEEKYNNKVMEHRGRAVNRMEHTGDNGSRHTYYWIEYPIDEPHHDIMNVYKVGCIVTPGEGGGTTVLYVLTCNDVILTKESEQKEVLDIVSKFGKPAETIELNIVLPTNFPKHIQDLQEGKLIYRGSRICMTKDLGVHGNLFGGVMLSILDETAAIFACEVCDTPLMVTKKMEEVVFDLPVKSGEIIKIYCGIAKIGNSSITLPVEARNYNVYTEKEEVVCHTRIIFVRIDERGNAIPISERIKKKFIKGFKP